MTAAAIEIRDLFRVYATPEGDAAALQGLSLTVREGEVVTVLGPSGAGKSTLLRLLAGLDRPSAGSLRVFGAELGKLKGRALAAYRSRTLGYADQHYSRALAPELTARELVALRLLLAGTGRRRAHARAEALLEQVNLAHRRDARPAELSGGEQQRVALCAALAGAPKLFLLDEPAGELDAANARLVYDVIGELARDGGCTSVVVSHDPESTTIADRTIRIRDGRVSEETLRDGRAEGLIVVGRGGWLRLPEEYLRHAGIESRATARLEDDRIVVVRAPGDAPPTDPGTADARPAPDPAGPRAGGEPARAEVRDLVKRYGSGPTATTAIDGLTASFEGGRLYAVTGPSGSGKTTLLHLLAGLELPSAGEILVAGTELTALDRSARAAFRRERIALVEQQAGLVPFLSARENIELGLAIRGRKPAGTHRTALDALAAVGLAERSEQRVGRLSSGERVRVAIARALSVQPALLLADEPTARLDAANALNVATLLARLADETGAVVLCSTHDSLVVAQADAELALGR